MFILIESLDPRRALAKLKPTLRHCLTGPLSGKPLNEGSSLSLELIEIFLAIIEVFLKGGVELGEL